MKMIKKVFVLILLCLVLAQCAYAGTEHPLIKGYITNKMYKPVKLKVFEVDKNAVSSLERNLEDNSYTPAVNLKIVTEVPKDYFLELADETIYIPGGTQLSGLISEIYPSKSFNRKGYYRVTLNQATCPDGEKLYLHSEIASKSESMTYNPLGHIGKTTLSLVGGALAGTLLSYQLGGLGLAFVSHGYSLAAGASAGGFIGALLGVTQKGKESSIEPGDDIVIIPVDEVSFGALKQIQCKNGKQYYDEDKAVEIQVISVRKQNEFIGEASIKLKAKIKNNSKEPLRISNFFLRDSQGKEYTPSIMNLKTDIFETVKPDEIKIVEIEYFVDHPKAYHWLVIKDRNLAHEVEKIKIF